MTKKNKQSGGRVLMPIQYFDPKNKVPMYYPDGAPQLKLPNNAYGETIAVSFGVPTGKAFPNSVGPNLAPYPNNSNLQTGGSLYNKIVNPETGRKVNINGPIGRKVLKKYNSHLY